MSANPTRVDWAAASSDPDFPLHQGNLVLESIARQHGLHALLAFSALRDQIRNRHMAPGSTSDRERVQENLVQTDLLQTERFVLEEVLQLICDRLRIITRADGIAVALAESQKVISSFSVGALAEHKVPIDDSRFLRDCLKVDEILRCDDCDEDMRRDLDSARQVGARSAVLVPLRGHGKPLGLLQAFSRAPWAFTDDDIRTFDLFSELLLSALKPEDQDRRIHWLSDVADEVLRPKPVAAFEDAPKAVEEIRPARSLEGEVDGEVHQSLSATAPDSHVSLLAQPLVIPAATIELSGPGVADDLLESVSTGSAETLPDVVRPSFSLSFLRRSFVPSSSLPGLSVVMGLVAVAALFSAGVWWGMQIHGKPAVRASAANSVAATNSAPARPAIETASAASLLPAAASDNLMDPAKLGADALPLAGVAPDKLAALPKVTGVRHWSSSIGSTVVIDMEDQVPYEVHRLMSPERIYFDLHDTALAHELDGKTMDVGDPSLTRVRVAQPVAGVTRIVLDTKDGSNFSVSMESSPYRLVVELRGSEKTLITDRFTSSPAIQNQNSQIQIGQKQVVDSDAALNHPTSSSVDRPQAPMKAASAAALATKASTEPLPVKTGKFRVVLDAGHGGWDLGTVGRQGLLEKDLVLDVTQRLGKLLQARLGSEVMFTRSDDTYLPLDQRADFANQAQADLFVSVHANYSTSAAARGVETYYTNLFSAPFSGSGAREREAARRDDGSSAKLTTVALSAGSLHEKIEDSRRLATSVQRSLYSTLAAHSPDIRDRGIKDSAFVVLTGTTMPAILTEISFVSSPADERNLQSAAYRQQIAEALYQGIARYQQSSPRAKVAQLQTAAVRR